MAKKHHFCAVCKETNNFQTENGENEEDADMINNDEDMLDMYDGQRSNVNVTKTDGGETNNDKITLEGDGDAFNQWAVTKDTTFGATNTGIDSDGDI